MGWLSRKQKLKSTTVKLSVPGVLKLGGTWEADEAQQQAAWEIYVELVTRISLVELPDDHGLLREALSSLYSLFGTTRDVLRSHGPSIARPARPHRLTLGRIAVAIVNKVVRPTLTKWHPLLRDHEGRRPPDVTLVDHERAWERSGELREELARVRSVLGSYADLLAEACSIESLVTTS